MPELRPKDVEFARKVITTVRHGGIWKLPKVGALFLVDHHVKKLILKKKVKEFKLSEVERVFNAVGYVVIDATNIRPRRGLFSTGYSYSPEYTFNWSPSQFVVSSV